MGASILCPIDFSEASRGSLQYAFAIASKFETELTVLTVDDPLLASVGTMKMGEDWARHNSERQLRAFVADAQGPRPQPSRMQFKVRAGKPAIEILKIAQQDSCDLILMSSHGRTGPSKWVLGATAERVLRGTTVPVLITPPVDPGPLALDALALRAGRVLVPIDMSGATPHQVQVAASVAAQLGLPLLLAHVVEPLQLPVPVELDLTELNADRFAGAKRALTALAADIPGLIPRETAIAIGDPAAEIATIAREHHAGLIVMGLHGSPMLGPRMGSVTYRTMCQVSAVVLALPPVAISSPTA